jgi:signal transduction histidine kinase
MVTFKARARALDMLGRQQIAGIPTAISELFKNAHDAYADRVVVDYFRSESLVILRDDGVGMSRQDFEERWLTIGTESKLGQSGLAPPPIDSTKPQRAILGEKGIGRLAIAVLGPQVLILTRPRRAGVVGRTTIAFVNWRMYELPGINLDEIQVPIEETDGGVLPDQAIVTSLVNQIRLNLRGFGNRVGTEIAAAIEKDLDSFKPNIIEMGRQLGAPTLTDTGSGTHFYIQPADALLGTLIDGQDSNDTASTLTKMLIGFSNTMTPGHKSPALLTSFRDHKSSELSDELISEREFFTPGEFKSADHHIEGRFNEFGQFRGTVSVYGKRTPNHSVPWKGDNRRAICGPFSINVAYVQGRFAETRLPPTAYAHMTKKLERIGGLYIYRDGIRVLPYGNNDFDFLDIEKNRTKSAGYYFFSYRRIIGAIEIGHSENPHLVEKAGREGFRENRAYIDFKDILKNFFVQIAADFFREGGQRAELFFDRRAELEKLNEARKLREAASGKSRRDLESRLDEFFKKVKTGEPAAEVAAVTEQAIKSVEKILGDSKVKDIEEKISEIQSESLRAIEEIREKFTVKRPAGTGMTRVLRRDLEASEFEGRKLRKEVFGPAADHLVETVKRSARNKGIRLDTQKWLKSLVDKEAKRSAGRAPRERAETLELANKLVQEIDSLANSLEAELVKEVERVQTRYAKMVAGADDANSASQLASSYESDLELATRNALDGFKSLRDQVSALHWTRGDDGSFIGITLMNEALEEDLISLRERAEADLELTQLGMAINVVSHEFENNVNGIRSSLRRLKAWADKNPSIGNLYNSLYNSFVHLDAYLTLFTPLQRRLHKQRIEFTGADISKFIRELFSQRFERHKIAFEPSERFQKRAITGYPSTFYPVFINLIDNAIFWLKDRRPPRTIRLDANGNSLLISDNGPGIADSDKEEIFEMGFTRKPGGRGLGLYISREVLDREGYTLSVGREAEHLGATFVIEPKF